jgi:hypothetical protein
MAPPESFTVKEHDVVLDWHEMELKSRVEGDEAAVDSLNT